MDFIASSADAALDVLAGALAAVNPNIPLSKPGNEDGDVVVYWFAPPRAYVIEWITTHAIMLPLLYFLSRGPKRFSVAGRAPDSPASDQTWRSRFLHFFDLLLTFILVASEQLANTVHYMQLVNSPALSFSCRLRGHAVFQNFNKSGILFANAVQCIFLPARVPSVRPRECCEPRDL